MISTKKIEESRLIVIIILIICFFITFIVRLFYLQVLQGNIFKNRAAQNQTRDIRIASYRSIIYDRNKQLKLAYNKRSMILTVIEANLPKLNTVERIEQITEMAKILKTTPESICTVIKEQFIDPYTPIILQKDTSLEVITQFAEKIDKFPGVFWENQPNRVYPFKQSGFHVIGYTGLLDPKEYQLYRNRDEYFLGTFIGKGGIEKYYDELIRGKSGTLVRSVNARGQVLQQDVVKEPVQGDHLVLTIDAKLQEKVYELMKNFVGSAIVSHAKTGEILALVSTPSIDPAIFNNTQRVKDEFHPLVLDPQRPFLNRGIQGLYPPASTFKLVSSAAFLKDGVDPNFVLNTTGSYTIGDRTFRDWKNHGKINARRALEVSGNVYFYHFSQSVGRQKIFQMAREFGFTQPYGIDLPDEKSGFIPNDQWFKRMHRRNWSHGDTANIAIGQGDVLTTPLEINIMTSAIANNGIIYKPYILKERLRVRDKQVIWEQKPTPFKVLNLSSENIKILQEGMRNVLVGKNGTARWLETYKIIRVPIAGKTGTAQTGFKRANNGLFTAYGPYNTEGNTDDTIVVTVLLEQTSTGNAVRIVGELFNYYFEELYPKKNPNFQSRRG